MTILTDNYGNVVHLNENNAIITPPKVKTREEQFMETVESVTFPVFRGLPQDRGEVAFEKQRGSEVVGNSAPWACYAMFQAEPTRHGNYYYHLYVRARQWDYGSRSVVPRSDWFGQFNGSYPKTISDEMLRVNIVVVRQLANYLNAQLLSKGARIGECRFVGVEGTLDTEIAGVKYSGRRTYSFNVEKEFWELGYNRETDVSLYAHVEAATPKIHRPD
jgi:hypothetical protein